MNDSTSKPSKVAEALLAQMKANMADDDFDRRIAERNARLGAEMAAKHGLTPTEEPESPEPRDDATRSI